MHKSTFIRAFIVAAVSGICWNAGFAAPPILNPNQTPFPRSSLHDFSDLAPNTVEQRGFAQSRDGHFYWEDGTRAKFWGINVANASLMESDEQITAMIENFRQSGFNLIRLHHFDERNGIIDMTRDDSQHFVAERLRKIDFWVYQARQNGMYIYLDLLDYRQFKDGDDVPNSQAIGRAARPYAVFDKRLIELQKEYAKVLLTHENPYTKLKYVDDPTIAMAEIYSESGLFMKRVVWREMPKPYNAQFQKLWNDWLRERYKSTFALREAWNGELEARENVENGSVELPLMTWTPEKAPQSQQIYASQLRRNDGARFAAFVQQKYFSEMRDYLRGLGLKIPVSVTGRFEDLADTKSIASELDFIGTNLYYDHPYWAAGKPAWKLPSYFHGQDPLQNDDLHSFIAAVGVSKVRNKPLVVREWNYCWPNTGRDAGMLEAASYASFQDIDAMILFTYETADTARVSYFNVRSDPSRWGLVGIAAQIFLKQIVAPSKYKAIIPYSDAEVSTYSSYYQALYSLGWVARLENDFYAENYAAPDESTLLVAPGRNAKSLGGAPSVLWKNGDGNAAQAWDMQNKRVNLGATTSRQALAGSLNALHQFFDAPFDWKVLLEKKYSADNGRLVRDWKNGVLRINESRIQAIAGNLNNDAQSGNLKIRGLQKGVVSLLSLDDLPTEKSQHFLLKVMTNAANVDEKVRPDPRFAHRSDGQWMVDIYGKGPVTTNGKPSAQPIEIWRGSQLLVKIYQNRGSFELLMNNGQWQFYTDTTNVRFVIYHGKNDDKHGKTDAVQSQSLQAMQINGKLRSLSGLRQGNASIARFPQETAYIQFPVQEPVH